MIQLFFDYLIIKYISCIELQKTIRKIKQFRIRTWGKYIT